jgi:hypothetical protein
MGKLSTGTFYDEKKEQRKEVNVFKRNLKEPANNRQAPFCQILVSNLTTTATAAFNKTTLTVTTCKNKKNNIN